MKKAYLILLCAALMLGGCGEPKKTGNAVISIDETQVKEGFAPIPQAEEIIAEDAMNVAGELQEDQGNVMVRLQAGKLSGSGVIYEADDSFVWIATAKHVLEQMEDVVKVTFEDGFETETKNVVRSPKLDLAFVKLERSALTEETKALGQEKTTFVDHGINYRCALASQKAYDAAKAGDQVIAMGSKSGVGEDAFAGTLLEDYVFVNDFDAYMMIADVNVTPGMSGGGLFDAHGNLLGIICGVSEDGQVAAAPFLALLAMER